MLWRRRESKLKRPKSENPSETRPWPVRPRGCPRSQRRLVAVRDGEIGVALHGDGTPAARRLSSRRPGRIGCARHGSGQFSCREVGRQAQVEPTRKRARAVVGSAVADRPSSALLLGCRFTAARAERGPVAAQIGRRLHHQWASQAGWYGRDPTFRPDGIIAAVSPQG